MSNVCLCITICITLHSAATPGDAGRRASRRACPSAQRGGERGRTYSSTGTAYGRAAGCADAPGRETRSALVALGHTGRPACVGACAPDGCMRNAHLIARYPSERPPRHAATRAPCARPRHHRGASPGRRLCGDPTHGVRRRVRQVPYVLQADDACRDGGARRSGCPREFLVTDSKAGYK